MNRVLAATVLLSIMAAVITAGCGAHTDTRNPAKSTPESAFENMVRVLKARTQTGSSR